MFTKSRIFRFAAAALAAFSVLAPPAQAAAIPVTMQFRVPAASLQVVESKGMVSAGPASLDFGDQQPGFMSSGLTATLSNNGNAPFNVVGISAANPFSVNSTCPASLGAGQSCAVNVFFTPTGMGAAQGSLALATDVGTATVRLSGIGALYTANIAPALLDFGDGDVNSTSAPQSVSLSNTGNRPLPVNSTNVSGPFKLNRDSCGTSVAAGTTCTYDIAFAPTAMGDTAGNFSVQTPAGGRSVTLHGFGRQSSQDVTVGALAFDPLAVGMTSTAQAVSLTNTGNTTLSVNSVAASGPYNVSHNCPTALAGGASCMASVTFAPVTMGAASGSLVFTTSLGARTVTLSGTGLQALAGIAPSQLVFGNQPVNVASDAKVVTLTNSGNTSMSVGAATASPPYAIAASTCGASLDASASCTYSITYTPTAMGVADGTLSVPTGAGAQSVSLSGTGLQAVIAVAPAQLAFGNQTVGSVSAAQLVTLSNTGNASTTLGVAAATAPFSIASTTCGTTLDAGASCNVAVSFAPAAMGSLTGSLSLPTGAGTQSVALGGTGVQTSGDLSIGTLTFGSQAVNTTSAAQSVTLTNTGNTPLTVASVTTSGQFNATHNCPATLPAGNACTVNAVFAPVSMGAQAGVLSVATGAGTYTAGLSGTGRLAVDAVSPTSLAFGNQTVNTTSAAQTVTLSNTGNTTSALSAATATSPFSIASTTCGASLAAGASCAYSVTFTPAAMNAASGTLSIPTDVGTKTVALSGNGQQTSGSLNLGTLAFGNQAVGTTSAAQSVTLNNTGNTALAVSSVSSSGQFNASHNCPASLAAGSSCTVNTAFAPASLGAHAGTLTVVTGGGTYTVGLSGTGLLAVDTVSPASLAFGNQTVSTTSAAQTVTLSNTGNTPSVLSAATVSGPFAIASSTCGASLAANASCAYSVTFTPSAMNAASGTLSIPTDVGTKTVSLSGNGQQTSGSLSTNSLAFGSLGVNATSTAQSVILTNTGNTSLSVSSVSVSGQYAQSNTCGSSVAAGANCVVNVTFNPTTMGSQAGTMTVVTAAGTYSAALSGTGLLAVDAVNPTSLSFGNQPISTTSAALTATLSNTGNTTSALSSATVSGPFTIASSTCGASLAANASCVYSVTFTPTAMNGAAGSLSIPTDTGTKTVSLSGNGQQTSGSTSVGSLDFGSLPVGSTSAAQAVAVNNTGNTPLAVSKVSVTGPYNVAHNCPGSLAAGSNCTVNVAFAPTAMGSQPGTLTVSTAAGNYAVTLSGIGQQVAIAANPASLAFGGQAVSTVSATQTVTLSNTGNIAGSLGTATVTAPFEIGSTTCSSSLAAGASCTYLVRFHPSAMGAASGTLTVPSASGNQVVSLSGTGNQTVLAAAPTSLAFGNVQSGQTSVKTFTLTNSGNLAASSLSLAGPAGYSQASNCGTSLAASSSCTVTVTFAPTAVQAYSGSLTVTSATASTAVSLTGAGVVPALSLTPASMAFGVVPVNTRSAAQGFTVTNTGVGPLIIGSISLPSGAVLSSDTCSGQTVGVGGSCTGSVSIQPGAVAAYSGTVTIASNATGSANTIALSGYGGQNDSLLGPAYGTATGEANAAWVGTGYGYVWSTSGYATSAAVGDVHFETLLTNSTGAPTTIYIHASVDNIADGLKLGGVAQSLGCLATTGFGAVCTAGPYTLQPGTTRLDISINNGGTSANPAGISAWVTNAAGSVLATTNGSTGFYWTTAGF